MVQTVMRSVESVPTGIVNSKCEILVSKQWWGVNIPRQVLDATNDKKTKLSKLCDVFQKVETVDSIPDDAWHQVFLLLSGIRSIPVDTLIQFRKSTFNEDIIGPKYHRGIRAMLEACARNRDYIRGFDILKSDFKKNQGTGLADDTIGLYETCISCFLSNEEEMNIDLKKSMLVEIETMLRSDLRFYSDGGMYSSYSPRSFSLLIQAYLKLHSKGRMRIIRILGVSCEKRYILSESEFVAVARALQRLRQWDTVNDVELWMRSLELHKVPGIASSLLGVYSSICIRTDIRTGEPTQIPWFHYTKGHFRCAVAEAESMHSQSKSIRNLHKLMFRIYCGLGSEDMVLEFVQSEMIPRKMELSLSDYHSLIYLHGNRLGNFQAAVNVVGEMQSNNCIPSSVTLDWLTRALLTYGEKRVDEGDLLLLVGNIISLSRTFNMRPAGYSIDKIIKYTSSLGMETETNQLKDLKATIRSEDVLDL